MLEAGHGANEQERKRQKNEAKFTECGCRLVFYSKLMPMLTPSCITQIQNHTPRPTSSRCFLLINTVGVKTRLVITDQLFGQKVNLVITINRSYNFQLEL